MEKNGFQKGRWWSVLIKILMIMKLSIFILCLTVFSVTATEIFSQNSKLSLSMRNVAIEDVLKSIEDNSEYRFFYTEKLSVENKVSIDCEKKSIDEVLDGIFRGTDIAYRIVGRQIALYKNSGDPSVFQTEQPRSVSGKVTDSSGGVLPGVSVVVKGTTTGTVTDANGNYSLANVPSNATLQFSFVGMKSAEVSVGSKTTINISLAEEMFGLDEVVAVGYGTQKKVNLTGAVSSINAEKLAAVPTSNVSSLLYGTLPGLTALQRSGLPGADNVVMSIRGFGGALVVVDGVVGRDFSRLDPNEIESITILKDAASSAIYGVSGGNGVILVTTKRGTVGKPVLSYTMNYGVQHRTRYPRFVNSWEYATLRNEASVNIGGKPVYTPEQLQKFQDGSDPVNYPNFDYYKYMINDYAPMKDQNISISGGSEKIKYYFLLGQTSQASRWKTYGGGNQEYSKYNFRSNIDAQITDDLDVSVEFGGRYENRDNLTQNAYLMSSWLQFQWPIANPFTPDGKLEATNQGMIGYLDRNLSGYNRNEAYFFQGGLSVNYKVPWVKGLSINVKGASDLYFANQKIWQKKFPYYKWDPSTNTSYQTGALQVNALTLDNWRSSALRTISSINYNRTFASAHNVKALLLYEVSSYKGDNFQATRTGYVVPIDQIFAGPDLNKSNSGGASDNGRESYAGRLNYDYKGKYLFEYNFRYDGSARFPPDKRWGFFSGVSAGWRISDEKFIKNNFKAIENLKLRGSWGELGSDVTGNYQHLAGYTYPSGNYILGSNIVTNGMVDSGTPNPNITWEKSQIFDFGFDLSLWKRKLEVEADVYYRKREGLLATRSLQLPSTFGATLPLENLNADNTRGFEILLRHNNQIGQVKYSVSPYLSYARAKNSHLEQRAFTSQYDNWRSNSENRWSNIYWGYKAIGQFQNKAELVSSPIQDRRANSTLLPGDIKYDDFNQDGVIDGNDIQPIGKSAFPELNYGLGLNASWKKFSIDMNWQGSSNFNIVQQLNLIHPFQYNIMNTYHYFMDRWHRTDINDPNSAWIPGKYPATIAQGSTNNNMNSSFWLLNAKYLRLRTLNISYNLESSFLKRHKIEALTIILSGQNILTIANTGELDPEAPIGRGSYYPEMMSYNIGFNIKF